MRQSALIAPIALIALVGFVIAINERIVQGVFVISVHRRRVLCLASLLFRGLVCRLEPHRLLQRTGHGGAHGTQLRSKTRIDGAEVRFAKTTARSEPLVG
jgi:hypothetical protein